MGQKIHPKGFRIGVIEGWDSFWYADDREYGKLLAEDLKLRSYLKDLSTKDSGPRSSYVMRRELVKSFGSLEAMESSWRNYLAILQLLETAGSGR